MTDAIEFQEELNKMHFWSEVDKLPDDFMMREYLFHVRLQNLDLYNYMDDLCAIRRVSCSLIRCVVEYCSMLTMVSRQPNSSKMISLQMKFVRLCYVQYLPYLDGCEACDHDTLEPRRFALSMMFSFDLMNDPVRSYDNYNYLLQNKQRRNK